MASWKTGAKRRKQNSIMYFTIIVCGEKSFVIIQRAGKFIRHSPKSNIHLEWLRAE